jgi:hypothetical protein
LEGFLVNNLCRLTSGAKMAANCKGIEYRVKNASKGHQTRLVYDKQEIRPEFTLKKVIDQH